MKPIEFDENLLTRNERRVLALRTLYGKAGFLPFRMSKFEEYDYYAGNKEFLVSDSVITFTDTNGKLMALKPDVTLSIIKSIVDRPDEIRKVYYNENVYRVDKGTGAFREIPQAGLEVFGKIDEKTLGETVLLAAKSLSVFSEDYKLVISDLDILSGLIFSLCDSPEVQKDLFRCAGEKNLHGIADICAKYALDPGKERNLNDLLHFTEKRNLSFRNSESVSVRLFPKRSPDWKRFFSCSRTKTEPGN